MHRIITTPDTQNHEETDNSQVTGSSPRNAVTITRTFDLARSHPEASSQTCSRQPDRTHVNQCRTYTPMRLRPHLEKRKGDIQVSSWLHELTINKELCPSISFRGGQAADISS